MKPTKSSSFSLIWFAVAFWFLSVLLNFNYPANQPYSAGLLLPSPDIWLLSAALALVACLGRRWLLWSSGLIWLVFLGLRLFRIGDAAVPMYLNRPFNLYIDSRYLYGLYDLLKTSASQGEFSVLSAELVAAALVVAATSWFAWRTIAKGLAVPWFRFSYLVVSALALGAVYRWGWPLAEPPATVKLGRELVAIRHQHERERDMFARIEAARNERPTGLVPLKGLKNADVLLFVVESYGHIVFSKPEYRKGMKAAMSRFSQTLEEHGYKAVSSYLDSPTYGGSSWLAHSTLEFGVRVENDLEDAMLLRSSLPPLAAYFRRSGYRTVSVMPGTRFAFPEGAAFRYEQNYYARDFGYRGPSFGWSPMPDQFVLDWVRRREFGIPRQPLFVRYILVSSHAAFSLQPLFIKNWDAIGDGSVYNEQRQIYYPIYWPDLQNAGEAYLRSLDYDFTVLGDYLAKYVDSDSLILIVGDHQPNVQLTGEGQPWSVPVHVISRDERLLAPFIKRGYSHGLLPTQPPPHGGMQYFLKDFLEDFRE